MGSLIPDIDKETTIRKVRHFFQDENQYPKIRRNAWDDGVKSPVTDETGVRSSSQGNSSERMMIYYSECSQAKKAVEGAIKACSAKSIDILKLRYCQGLFVWQVKERITHDLGHSTYSDADKQACLEFADACDRLGSQLHTDPDVLPKFVTFKDQEQNGNKLGAKREQIRK